MAVYGTADVTYSVIEGFSVAGQENPMAGRVFSMSVAGGKTYPAGGIPLVKGKLGCPATIQRFLLMDAGSSSGQVAKYDLSANAIRLYQVSNTTTLAFTSALTEVGTAETVAATTWKAFVAGW